MASSVILTAATLPRTNSVGSVLYLGSWCFPDPTAVSGDEEFLTHHWEDRESMERDNLELKLTSDSLILALGERLNQIHQTNHSERYWKIILGMWAINFTTVVYDRWMTVQSAVRSGKMDGKICLSTDSSSFVVPNDYAEFKRQNINHEWNEQLFYRILEFLPNEFIFETCHKNTVVSPKQGSNSVRSSVVKMRLRNLLFRLKRRDKYVFSAPYIAPTLLRRLQVSFFQLPVTMPLIEIPQVATQSTLRKLLCENLKLSPPNSSADAQAYIELLLELLPTCFPKSFLEGYARINTLWKRGHWPQKVKSIVTAVSVYHDEVFKSWAATQVERGSRLVLCQHGGFYGTALFAQSEDFELSICDDYLSWGWSRQGFPQIRPIGNFKNYGTSIKPKLTGKALMSLTDGFLLPHRLDSEPVSSVQWMKYHQEQIELYDSFPEIFRSNIRVRPYPSTEFHEIRKYWANLFPSAELDDITTSFSTSLSNSRILIVGDNNTTWLDALNLNFPVVIHLDPELWELREEARLAFCLLEESGILHRNPVSLTNHVLSIWDDIDAWWSSPETSSARMKFAEQYSRSNSKMFREIRNVIKS